MPTGGREVAGVYWRMVTSLAWPKARSVEWSRLKTGRRSSRAESEFSAGLEDQLSVIAAALGGSGVRRGTPVMDEQRAPNQ